MLRRPASEAVADQLLVRGRVVHAPHLIDAEVAQVLRRLERAGTLPSPRALEALADFRAVRIVRHGHEPLLDRVWGLRDNLSAYDALYVALAEGLGAPLLTMDGAIARAPGHGANVINC